MGAEGGNPALTIGKSVNYYYLCKAFRRGRQSSPNFLDI